MKKVKLILVDDHKIFLDGLESLLSSIDQFSVVFCASSGEQLFSKIEEHLPDIVITDISLKGISGIDITRRIKQDFKSIKVLILSMHINEEFVLNSVKAGADGYLPKDSSIEELIEAIVTVNEGGQYFSKSISDFFFKNYINRYKYEQELTEKYELTNREIEILKLSATGLTNKEIANKLYISIKTVDTHKTHIMHKLKLKNSAELVIFAIKNKMVEL